MLPTGTKASDSARMWRKIAYVSPASIAIVIAFVLLFSGESLAQSDGLAKSTWIAANPDSAESVSLSENGPLPLFRKSFVLPGKPVSAVLEISGLGQYEARINGRKISSAVLTPGWTLYTRHVLFDAYDVTRLLRPGGNAIGVMVGNGMYRVLPSPGRYTKFERSFGQPKLIAALTIRFADHPDMVIPSGADWSTAPGPITFSSTYGGEDFDARLEPRNWTSAQFDGSGWSRAYVVGGPGGALMRETTPPIKVLRTFTPVKTTHPAPNVMVYDLGQNFAGWPAIEVTGPRGASVKLLAGELLTAAGFVTQRSANAGADDPNLFTYTLRGGATVQDPETWHPRFSYYGFRYVQAETSPGVTILRLNGQSIHDDVVRIGSFTSSSSLFNRVHAIIDNAMLSNMVSVLTDCPHREKLGWLEQSHLAGAALNYNWELSSLYQKISDDMADSQKASGLVPSIAPEFPVFSGPFRDSPEWGSAVVLSPWIAYQFSGDPHSLRDHYASMQRYVTYLGGRTHGHLLDYGLGDWYDIGPGDPGESKLTTLGLTASAIYYQDLTTLARIAVIAGHPEDAHTYAAEAQAVKSAFNTAFFHAETDVYDRGSQTAQAMPLALGLVPPGHEAGVLNSLVASIRITGNHVTAGDIGFHYLVRALTDGGRSDVLYDMLSRTDPPSYGAQVAAGVTTLAESWDANPKDSQNHFMLGDAEEWFYRGLAGIDFDRSRGAGEEIRISPAVIGSLTSASATLHSSLGVIKSAWSRQSPSSDALSVDLEIPPATTARFIVPPSYRSPVRERDRRRGKDDRGGRNIGGAGSELVLPGGTYHFVLKKSRRRTWQPDALPLANG